MSVTNKISQILFKNLDKPSLLSRKNDLTYRIALLFLILALPYIPIFLALQLPLSTSIVVGTIVMFGVSMSLNTLKWYNTSKLILIAGPSLSFFACANILSPEAGAQFLLFTLLPLPLLLFNITQVLWITGTAFIPIGAYVALEVGGYKWLQYYEFIPPETMVYIRISAIVTTFILLGLSAASYFISNRRYELKLEEKNSELEKNNMALISSQEEIKIQNKILNETNQKLTQETKEKEASLLREFENAKQLEAQAQLIRDQEANKRLLAQAKEYQDTLYQNTPPKVEKQAISAHGVASHHISGDYRYMKALAPKLSASVVLDVTGHGAPAAMMTGILAKLVDEWMESEDIEVLKDPSKALDALNKILCREPRITRFVAGIYMVVDTQTYQAHIACAGSEAPLIYRNNTLIPIPSVNTSLCMDEDSTYDTVTVPIHPNDILIAATDGLVDLTLATPKNTPTPLVPRLEGPLDDYGDPIPILDYTTLTRLLNKSLKPTPIPETGTPKSRSKPLATKIGDILHKTCLPSKDDMTMVVVGVA